ncbi:hypothetical protein ACLOJK_003585 [Asimina triloba]
MKVKRCQSAGAGRTQASKSLHTPIFKARLVWAFADHESVELRPPSPIACPPASVPAVLRPRGILVFFRPAPLLVPSGCAVCQCCASQCRRSGQRLELKLGNWGPHAIHRLIIAVDLVAGTNLRSRSFGGLLNHLLHLGNDFWRGAVYDGARLGRVSKLMFSWAD